jgi:hypothetical protein
MTRFLRTDEGELINAERIERIRDVTNPIRGLGRSRATLSDGISVTLTYEIGEIEQALLPIVAAVPGYVHLRYYDGSVEEGGPVVVRMPVVAWRIAEDRALPVLTEERTEDSVCIGEAVLQPDGQVVEPYEGRYPNEEVWRAEMEKRAAAARKPKLPHRYSERMSSNG